MGRKLRRKPHADNPLIDEMGGTGALARKCGLTTQAISKWRSEGIPKAWRRFLATQYPSLFVRDHK